MSESRWDACGNAVRGPGTLFGPRLALQIRINLVINAVHSGASVAMAASGVLSTDHEHVRNMNVLVKKIHALAPIVVTARESIARIIRFYTKNANANSANQATQWEDISLVRSII